MLDGPIPEGLTFDDVLLVPNKSAILPTEVDTRTRVTRHITLNIPIVSAAMDTVTESRLAIALAQQGGIGIVHRSMSIAQQALEVDKVKRRGRWSGRSQTQPAAAAKPASRAMAESALG